MELPPQLRRNVDRALSGVALADLAAAAAALSQRYRDERRDGNLHVRNERDALAYIAVRLPATYAVARQKRYSMSVLGREPPCGRLPIVGPVSPTPYCSRRARSFALVVKTSRARPTCRASVGD
jgi:hypothetical protein